MLRLSVLRKIEPVAPLVTAGHFTHHLCTGVLVAVLPLLRDEFQMDYFRSGLLVSAYNVVDGVAQVPMGRLADRFDKKLLLPLGLWMVALSAMAIGLTNSYYMVVVLLMLMGLVSGIQHPTAAALLSEYFPKNRARAFGLNMIGGSASFLTTYPLAGLIANAAGWRWAYLLLPIPALITGLLFWQIMKGREPEEVTQSLPCGQGRRAGPSIPVWQGIRLIGIVLIISILSRMLTSGTVPLLSLYLVDKHNVVPALAGPLIGLIYGAGIVGAPLSGVLSDRLGRKAVFLVCVAAIGPLILLITLAPSPLALLPIFILLGMAMQGREPPLQSLVAEAVPQEQRATMMGVYFFLSMEMGGLSSPLTGFLMEQLGPDRALTYLALGAIALSAVIWLVRKKV